MSNVYLLHDKDRHGWTEATAHVSERARRRGIVNTFLASRSYWTLLVYLSRGTGKLKFYSLDEAVRHWRGVDPTRYVVARYFRAARWSWL